MALGWQALEAQKADKPLEQGGALEQVAARIKRVMGLTPKFTGKIAVAKRRQVFPVQRLVRHNSPPAFEWMDTPRNHKSNKRNNALAWDVAPFCSLNTRRKTGNCLWAWFLFGTCHNLGR